MTSEGDRRLAFVFGLLGALLLVLAAVVRFFLGVVFLATGHGYLGVGSLAESVLYLVIGLIVGLFAFLGQRRGADRAVMAGIVLIVLAIVGWFTLGFGGSILALLGAVFALISGIVFVIAGK
jgi:hypothetical protein